jgi:3-isopropylmalate/(R)-2-methylmalate dehydratase small subunit
VISTYFADIFRGNALKNGLLPVQVDAETHRQLISLAEEDSSVQVTVDLEKQTVTLPDGRSVNFPIDPFSRYCLLNGVDQLGFLLNLDEQVTEYEGAHPARVQTTAS